MCINWCLRLGQIFDQQRIKIWNNKTICQTFSLLQIKFCPNLARKLFYHWKFESYANFRVLTICEYNTATITTLKAHLHIASKMPSSNLHRIFRGHARIFRWWLEFFDEMYISQLFFKKIKFVHDREKFDDASMKCPWSFDDGMCKWDLKSS